MPTESPMNVSIKAANYARKFDMAPKYWDDIFGEFDDCMRSKAVPNQFRASAQVPRWRPSQKRTAEEGLVLALKSLLWNLCWTSDSPWDWSKAISRRAQTLHGLEHYGLKQLLHIHRSQERIRGFFSGLTHLPSPTHIINPSLLCWYQFLLWGWYYHSSVYSIFRSTEPPVFEIHLINWLSFM